MLIQVVVLCRIVLERYQNAASDGNSPVYRALVLTTLSTSKPVRATALQEVKSLLADKSKAEVAKNLITKLNEILEEDKIFNAKEKKDGAEEKAAEVTGKMVLDCVQAFCSYRGKSPSCSRSGQATAETHRPVFPQSTLRKTRRRWRWRRCRPATTRWPPPCCSAPGSRSWPSCGSTPRSWSRCTPTRSTTLTSLTLRPLRCVGLQHSRY